MVQISRSNLRTRLRGPGGNPLLRQLHSFADGVPYLAQLSDMDRLLMLTGAILLAVVSFSYFFLLTGIVAPGALGGDVDPRLSSELRKTGLSEEALLRRGGGKRISVGTKRLDASENAVALDIIATLNCDALQDELERDWNTVLDKKKIEKENEEYWNKDYGGGDGGFGKYDGGKADDFAGELAAERGDVEGWDGADAADPGASGDGGEFDGVGGNEKLDDFVNRRRLLADDFVAATDDINPTWNTYGGGNSEPANQGLKLTGRHLFCLAAEGITLPKSTSASSPDPSTHCDVNSFEVREDLLYLWSSARGQMTEDEIQRTLRLVTEHQEDLRGNEVHLWYPDNDKGTEGMLRVLNSAYNGRETYNFDSEPADSSHDDLYRFHDLPSKFVGENKLFVDVGSALGLTSMLISYLYPGTTIVSIEPASPSWLIQNINFRCNLSRTQRQYVHPILAGVGTKHHDDNDSMMKMVWRPSETTATRNWNPEKDFDFAVDMELVVRLRTLRTILAETTPEDLPIGSPISVMNLDCEGCEYNLIPSMHETSFKSIGVILGRTNWGYIPVIKKPSSDRARQTHQRVCTHYNFAKRCKECCDFPSLEVKPRIHSAETETEEGAAAEDKTVAEVAGDMCNDFEEWAKDSKLRDIPDDYGWNEMSAFAAFD